ncbi:MAG TPA: FAD-binding protein [Burkholderiaceae bacterium]|nr:FAD-binding protein [Burkholderiaceae bacterium]
MTTRSNASDLRCDVLVIGGGPAGTWAAWSAACTGASVTLVDKGFCGTSGATAPSGTAIWWIAPDPALREAAKAQRETLGGHLASHAWMDRVLEHTWDNLERLAGWGYPFPRDEAGRDIRSSLQGPDYMRLMRRQVKQAGVRILDHHPALQLLVDADGAVRGASGVHGTDEQPWRIAARAVVLATGGCAFLSKALGTNVLTGDGHLMAARAGAVLSGMEFSNAYGLGPAFSSVTKSLFYKWATFYDESGRELEGAGSQRGRSVIARALMSGRVYAMLDRADASVHGWMRDAQPNYFLPFDRQGIDPFTQPFEVGLRLEGTVRGTGGLRVTAFDCRTDVPGLYAAGDAASREPICGGFTGGGSHNSAWAMSTGTWAGEAAARWAGREAAGRFAATGPAMTGSSIAHPATIGSATTRPAADEDAARTTSGSAAQHDAAELIAAVQREVFPIDRNWFRSGARLAESLDRLDAWWDRAGRAALPAAGPGSRRAHEALAMLATARWMYRSAQARTETRGMHRRDDHPSLDPAQRHHVLCGGLDEVWTGIGVGHRAAPPASQRIAA